MGNLRAYSSFSVLPCYPQPAQEIPERCKHRGIFHLKKIILFLVLVSYDPSNRMIL